jgi:type II secretory pathway predicted ATPase ExeA
MKTMKYLPDNLFELNDDFAKELGVSADVRSEAPVLVITGKNASGKSFLRRFMCMKLKQAKIEAMHLSQQGRSTEGVMRCFVYGSEDDESTGAISAKTFKTGMSTSRSRTTAHAIIWDEPEIGMGEELQVGSADWLFEQLADWPKHLRGIILLTHSRIFVKRAMEFSGAKWVNLDGYKTPEDWFNRKIVPVNPEEFSALAVEKWRRLCKMLKD